MKLVFATHNPNKIKEVQILLPPEIKILSLADIECHEDIPETSNSIEGNAKQKVTFIKETYGYDSFADDTGLVVDALDGAPGVYSARYAGAAKDSHANMDKLLTEMEGKNDRTAQFKTVIALELNNNLIVFTGVCKGTITYTKKGNGGFGYDPVFCPEGYTQTFAELRLDEKNKISHRGKAIRQFIDFLNH
ncbi:non-canonical purine NTP diphosphatase [Aquimarina sp. U1-2]|uniref:non-canonical purine NTP diphosphatase n=1 Tax=Aquimarina sp. U1-2 TaxID=2823141 RepID=UPI001AECCA78|nr:non-canonical purine NTP diphosphatase [Aquimarina sp. U1-2]MBP2832850.1 non-canonical purine NTP diphosphatase [Aquimarina sp. U1-2]